MDSHRTIFNARYDAFCTASFAATTKVNCIFIRQIASKERESDLDFSGGTWRELRQLTKETNALLREQRQAVEAIS